MISPDAIICRGQKQATTKFSPFFLFDYNGQSKGGELIEMKFEGLEFSFEVMFSLPSPTCC